MVPWALAFGPLAYEPTPFHIGVARKKHEPERRIAAPVHVESRIGMTLSAGCSLADPLRRRIGEDLAVADVHHAMSVVGNVRLVCHQHDRVSLCVELIEKGHDLHARLRVEVTGWL